MSVLSRDEYFARIEEMTKNHSDESITLLEDLTDTYNDLEKRANGDGENWKEKYDELDKTWKERYRHRFFSSDGGNASGGKGSEKADEDEYDPESVSIKDLFG